MTRLLRILAFVAASAFLASCGAVKDDGGDGDGDETCTWDDSNWDECSWAP